MKKELLSIPYAALMNAAEPAKEDTLFMSCYVMRMSFTIVINICLWTQQCVQWKESTRLRSRKNLLRELGDTLCFWFDCWLE